MTSTAISSVTISLLNHVLKSVQEWADAQVVAAPVSLLQSRQAAPVRAVDLTKFDPDWKSGKYFTTAGDHAITYAYRVAKLSPKEVSLLFRIGMASAYTYRNRVMGKPGAPAWPTRNR